MESVSCFMVIQLPFFHFKTKFNDKFSSYIVQKFFDTGSFSQGSYYPHSRSSALQETRTVGKTHEG